MEYETYELSLAGGVGVCQQKKKVLPAEGQAKAQKQHPELKKQQDACYDVSAGSI